MGARTAAKTDYIENDSTDLNSFNDNLLPENYQVDYCSKRNSCGNICNLQGDNLLDLCVSSRLRILNGRYIGDILGNFTCIFSNGNSVVDYAIVSEGLLPSVKYFLTNELNYLSDHTQIEFYLRCNLKIYENNNVFSNKNWSKTQDYKWDKKHSKQKLYDYLANETLINNIVEFEMKNFSEDQKGVDEATSKLTAILKQMSDSSCKIKLSSSKKSKKPRKQPWSDQAILELKHQINSIGRLIKANPFNTSYKIRYFSLLKQLKKLCKQKKYQFKQKLFEKLEDSFNNNTQEYWKILQNMKNNIEDECDEDILKNITPLVEHFQKQGTCNSINKEFQRQIENEMRMLEEYLVYTEQTDSPITCSEVKYVLNKLKMGKASGPDKILNEILKYSKTATLKSYTKLFNIIFKSGCYPKNWEQSYIITIHKSGDKSDLNNYRGIALMNCLSKIFSAVLNNRLKTFMENKYNISQFGFRENHRTSDSLFILKSLINKYLHKCKQKIYVCFVDLKKAFDSLWRNGLLYKLNKLGIGKQMYSIIKKQFENTLGSFKYKDFQSNFFETDRGVRQGDSISPTLFNIFINDITRIFENENNEPVEIIDSKVGSLLFADDLIILSKSKTGLQNSLNNLSEYCDKWQLTVNTSKTKSMIFQNNGCKPPNTFVKYKTTCIENVKEYKYLGCLISSNGSLVNCTSDLTNKARKVLFSIKSLTSKYGHLPIKVACNLFDTMVKPILTYNAEISFMDQYLKYYRAKKRSTKNNSEVDIFTFIDRTLPEKLHLSFCKNTLGTKKCSSNVAVRAELGRLPLESFISSQAIIYLARLNNENINPLLKEAFALTKNLNDTGIYSWYTYAKNIEEEIGVDDIQVINCKNIKQLKQFKTVIKKCSGTYYENLLNNKIENLNEENKIFLYKILKINKKEMEYYLGHPNFKYRQYITKFRMSDHQLLIETGRYYKIPRSQRLCEICKNIDDEFHFFFTCNINAVPRKVIIEQFNNFYSYFKDIDDNEKLILFLNPSTPDQIKTVVSFIEKSLELRKGDPQQS